MLKKNCIIGSTKSHQGRMEFGHGNVEDDRLSSLPDDVIHKVVSFISIRQAIEMSVLSSRWRFIWISMPYLNCSSWKLNPEFVSNVLSRRNSQIPVSSVKLGRVSSDSVERILNYTFSHNVQQLTITWDCKSSLGFSLSHFSSRSLKHLTLIGGVYTYCPYMTAPSCDLPVLTTLHLHDITMPLGYSDKGGCLFSKCSNLKNLSLSRCRVTLTDAFNICHPQLSNLTLHYIYGYGCNVVNVVAPQLKNLTVIHAFGKLSISAPALTSLVIKHHSHLQLSTQGLPSLEKVDLCFRYPFLKEAHILVSLLEQLHPIKFLTLNLEILEFLCSPLGPISHRLSRFANLKILKFLTSFPTRVYLEVRAHEKVTLSTEVKKFELDGSPGAVFSIVSCEEIGVMRNIVTTQKLIARLKKQWTNSALELQCRLMAQKLSETCRLISCLQHIEGLLTELPASKRDVMQAAFFSVCDEAAVVMNCSKRLTIN